MTHFQVCFYLGICYLWLALCYLIAHIFVTCGLASLLPVACIFVTYGLYLCYLWLFLLPDWLMARIFVTCSSSVAHLLPLVACTCYLWLVSLLPVAHLWLVSLLPFVACIVTCGSYLCYLVA